MRQAADPDPYPDSSTGLEVLTALAADVQIGSRSRPWNVKSDRSVGARPW
jgi:hypothetical protein